MRVLVTRPEPGASATAARLVDMGHEPIVLPLTEIRSLPVGEIETAGLDFVVVTSANAIRNAPERLAAKLRSLPLVAVGPATVEVCREAGFQSVMLPDDDADALIANVKDQDGITKAIYLAGRVRTPDIEDGLASAGIAVTLVETYDTVPVQAAAGALGVETIDAALVYSVNAAVALNGLLGREPAPFVHTTFFCISQRVADALDLPPDARLLVADSPNEIGMLRLLGNLRG